MGLELAQVDTQQVLDHLFTCLAARQGGWLLTANLDFLRRSACDAGDNDLYREADLCVADGMPLVWASRVLGERLPERVAGSSLVPLIAQRAAAEERSLYLLGGLPASNAEAARVLQERFPRLVICGRSSPPITEPPSPTQIAEVTGELTRRRPAIVLLGLGSPKQERLIQAVRHALPTSWMVGVGISFSFLAGHVRRAPPWIQDAGFEWLHRLAQEPRRLFRRYLIDDLPFALRLFAWSARERLETRAPRPPR
jgi:N-acetylglucosaminyldiphosphoundecaprenol N-acetyl-beta-D-mannosaminyltransferase